MTTTVEPTLDNLGAADRLRLKWLLQARPNQLTPSGRWLIWLLLAGRGFGKTRVGAEDVADWCHKNPGCRVGVIAPTLGSGKKVCIEGDSGLISVLPRGTYEYNKSELFLKLDNGCRIDVYSADQPERLRGPQHHRLWMDELAAWGPNMKNTWDMAMFGLRLPLPDNMPNQTVITTTPKPEKLIRDLMKRTTALVTYGKTTDNADNLGEAALAELLLQYEGTRLGRQELDAEILDDIEGAMFGLMNIEYNRLSMQDIDELDLDIFDKIVTAIDPSVSNNKDSDETGIVTVGRTASCPCGKATDESPHGIVLHDASVKGGVKDWMDAAVDQVEMYACEEVVAEVNNGGDLVETAWEGASARKQLSQGVRYHPVHASKGKRTRAEPVAMLYEKNRIHHWGQFGRLEDQMCSWIGNPCEKSPDRMDALVWASTRLFLPNGKRRGGLRP